jgi:hypothetical protein
MVMPVVVMTAYGSENLSAQVLIDGGANDYIPKPFGTGHDLERKIERALKGEGALVPASNIVQTVVRVAFHPTELLVCIETLSYKGAHYTLLGVLRDLYVSDLHGLRAPEKFAGIRGDALGAKLGIGGEAARRRVVKFRRQVERDFREQLGRAVGENDIIENSRDWSGYRLNPHVVRILAWDQMPRDQP